MTNDKIKVVYIGGYARCGSTILGNVLSEIEGFFNAGELMYIWDRMISENGICGCGKHITVCPIWSRVIKDAYGNIGEEECNKLIHMRDYSWKLKQLPLWVCNPTAKKNLLLNHKDFFVALTNLYTAIGKNLFGNVIIDTSKHPGYLFHLSMLSNIDIYVIHIVRDSRATAFSWLRKKKGFREVSLTKSSMQWISRNMSFDLFKSNFKRKYLRIRYEDFVEDPKSITRLILEILNESHKSLDFIQKDGIAFNENHCVYGNTDLFKRGKIKLKLDDEWKSRMDKIDKLKVTAITWPILKRYGY